MKLSVRQITIAGVLGAISIVLGMTPLGFIPVGMTNATTMHLPVILGGIVEGPVVGGLVGLIFGLSSLFNAMRNPTPLSFVFLNPLISVLPRVLIGVLAHYLYNSLKDKKPIIIDGLFKIIIIGFEAFLFYSAYNSFKSADRLNLTLNIIFIILLAALFYFLTKQEKGLISISLTAAITTGLHTLLVLGGIYLIYGQKYAMAIGIDPKMAGKVIGTVAITNGIPEIILAVIIITPVVRELVKSKKINRGD